MKVNSTHITVTVSLKQPSRNYLDKVEKAELDQVFISHGFKNVHPKLHTVYVKLPTTTLSVDLPCCIRK